MKCWSTPSTGRLGRCAALSFLVLAVVAGPSVAAPTPFHADSPAFKVNDTRCGTPSREARQALFPTPLFADPSDCSATMTNPTSEYDPTTVLRIPTVVHIIMNDACSQGVISDEMVQSQVWLDRICGHLSN